MAKTDYQDTAMNYVDDYMERLLRMESIMGSRLDQQKKSKERSFKIVKRSRKVI